MGSQPASTQTEEQRQKAIEQLRTNRVGVLLHIIDELDAMKLTATEIDSILRQYGLNEERALNEGSAIRAVKR